MQTHALVMMVVSDGITTVIFLSDQRPEGQTVPNDCLNVSIHIGEVGYLAHWCESSFEDESLQIRMD